MFLAWDVVDLTLMTFALQWNIHDQLLPYDTIRQARYPMNMVSQFPAILFDKTESQITILQYFDDTDDDTVEEQAHFHACTIDP
ncbi:hypothetical protein CFAM422_003521 [Trichoderma lentiforme]|uniref:Uncharacterized protein n=1 Tax=Trichoderma lentiforme TaxID=1567552 RepID=A0A9P4XMH3_9HYPO|nr:hypothetical protein CFAM422_003521 [Trichoderma lentiforme]